MKPTKMIAVIKIIQSAMERLEDMPCGGIGANGAPQAELDLASKAVLDALTDMGLWGDDKQVCDGRIQKRYASACPWIDDQRSGCLIEIKECV